MRLLSLVTISHLPIDEMYHYEKWTTILTEQSESGDAWRQFHEPPLIKTCPVVHRKLYVIFHILFSGSCSCLEHVYVENTWSKSSNITNQNDKVGIYPNPKFDKVNIWQ